MEKISVGKIGWLSTLSLSAVLLVGSALFSEANASTVSTGTSSTAAPITQLAWWAGGGGYGGPRYRGYGYRYNYGPNYYRPVYYGRQCTKQCWRDRWNRLQCVTRCR